jgi:predicted ATP-grasp superfamily ATP-dependent carboligase
LQKLLVLGFSTRGLAEAVAKSKEGSSYELLTLDYFGDYDQNQWGQSYSLWRDFGQASFSAQALATSATKLSYDTLAYTSGLDDEPDLVAELTTGRELLGNDSSTLRRVRDWEQLHRFLETNRFAYPRTLYQWQGPVPSGRWLLKPRKSGGGTNINWAAEEVHLSEDYLLQEYRASMPASVSFVANGQKAYVLGISEQLCGSRDFGASEFIYSGNIVPLWLDRWSEFPIGLWTWLKKLINLVTVEFGLKGLNGIDFLLTADDEPMFLEVNPRYSASMELFAAAYGYDLFSLHVKACQGFGVEQAVLPAICQRQGYWGKAIVYAPWDLSSGDTGGWFRAGIRDVPHPGEKISAHSPICTVLARGDTREECMEALREQQYWVLAQVIPNNRKGGGSGEG